MLVYTTLMINNLVLLKCIDQFSSFNGIILGILSGIKIALYERNLKHCCCHNPWKEHCLTINGFVENLPIDSHEHYKLWQGGHHGNLSNTIVLSWYLSNYLMNHNSSFPRMTWLNLIRWFLVCHVKAWTEWLIFCRCHLECILERYWKVFSQSNLRHIEICS